MLLAPEQTVVIEADVDAARAAARPMLRRYLGLRNYVASWRSLGFSEEDVAGEGSDRLVDEVIAHGDAATAAARVDEHLAAGADHVCVQVIGGDDPLPGLRALARELALS